MEIRFDEALVAETVQASAMAGIQRHLESYEVQRQIGEIMSAELVSGVIGNAIQQACRSVDFKSITQTLATEIAKSAVAATCVVIRDAMARTVARLRGIELYGSDGAAVLAKIAAEIKAGKEEL